MTIEELRQRLIDDLDLEPAFFVGGYGGAILELEEIRKATPEKLIEIARRKGYIVEVEDQEKHKEKYLKGR